MKWIVLALAALAAFWLVWNDPASVAERNDALIARYAEHQAQAQVAALSAQRDAALAPLYTALTALAYGLLGAVGVGVAAYVGTIGAIDVRRRATSVLPTSDGRMPVPTAYLPAASLAALGATHARLQLAATEQRLDRALLLPELLALPPGK